MTRVIDQAIQLRFSKTFTRDDNIAVTWSNTYTLTFETAIIYKSDNYTIDYMHWRWTHRTQTSGYIARIRWWVITLDEYYDKILPQQ